MIFLILGGFALAAALQHQGLDRALAGRVLLLFGGGLALGRVMEDSGGSRFLVDALVQQLYGAPPLLVLLGVVAFVVFMTELVSNTAVAALLVPVFRVVGARPRPAGPGAGGAIVVAASCACMLPVATSPNAIVYGTGQVPQATMMRCGLVLNLVYIGAVVAAAYLAFG